MAKLEYIGVPTSFDPTTCELKITIQFITPETQGMLEQLTTEKVSHKFTHTYHKKTSKTYEQQKFYYAFLREILIKNDIEPFKENMEILDEEIRLELFPCTEVDYGDKKIPRPMRMREMSHRQMARVLSRLVERYSYLNINL